MSNLTVNNTQKNVANTTITSGKILVSNSRNQDFSNTLQQQTDAYPKIDASIDLRGKVQVSKPLELTHEESITLLQKESGLTKEEAEKFLDPTYLVNMIKDGDELMKKAAENATPEAINNVLKTMKVDAVARDSNGNMVAKLYKDGTFICSPKLQAVITAAGADSLSGKEKMELIEKQSGVVALHNQNLSDFDLLKEAKALKNKLENNGLDPLGLLLTV